MFAKNQVRIKDLIYSNPIRTLKNDNADSMQDDSLSNSQYQYSQVDYVESQTQITGGSEMSSASSESPSKKLYGKYGNKAVFQVKKPIQRDNVRGKDMEKTPVVSVRARQDLMKKRSLSVGPTNLGLSYTEQLKQNKARLQEKEERDIMMTMVNCMKECATEVHTAVSIVKDHIEQGVAATQCELSDHLEKLQKDLDSHRNEMVKVMQVRDEMKDKIASLTETIALKDSKISDLEDQLQDSRDKQNRKMIQELQKSFFDGIEDTKDQITQAYEGHQKELKNVAKGQEAMKTDVLQHTQKLHNGAMEQSISTLRQLHAQVNEDIVECRESEKRGREEFEVRLRGDIEQIQRHQREDIKALLRQQLIEMDQMSDQKQDQAFQKQLKQLDELQLQHKADINHQIQKQLAEASNDQKKLVATMIEELWQKESRSAHLIQREQQRSAEDEMQKRCDKQLQEMRKKYEEEVENILNQQKQEILQRREQQQEQKRLQENPYTASSNSFNEIGHRLQTTIDINEVFDLQPNVAKYCSSYENSTYSYSNNRGNIEYSMNENSYRRSDVPVNHNEAKGMQLRSRNYGDMEDRNCEAEPNLINDKQNPNTSNRLLRSNLSNEKQKENIFKAPRSPWGVRKVGAFGQRGSSFDPKKIFVSPLLKNRTWTSKELFCKAQPSPVATVIPQVNNANKSNNPKATNAAATIRPELSVIRKVETENQAAGKKAKETAESSGTKKKPAKRRKGRRRYTNRKKPRTTKKSVEDQQNINLEESEVESEEENEVISASNKPVEVEPEPSTNTGTSKNDKSQQKSYLKPPPAPTSQPKSYQIPSSQSRSYQKPTPQPKSYQRTPAIATISARKDIYEFSDDTSFNKRKKDSKPDEDARWKAACDIQMKPSYKPMLQTQQPKPMLKTNPVRIGLQSVFLKRVQKDFDCSSVGSSPVYTLPDMIFKNKSIYLDADKSTDAVGESDLLSCTFAEDTSKHDAFDDLEVDDINGRDSFNNNKIMEDPLVSSVSTRRSKRRSSII